MFEKLGNIVGGTVVVLLSVFMLAFLLAMIERFTGIGTWGALAILFIGVPVAFAIHGKLFR